MARRKSTIPVPTDAELAILRILWRSGPSTVREVWDALGRPKAGGRKRVGYTTALKLLQIMHDKGLVARDESDRSHVYRPRVEEEETETRLVHDLARRVFAGSTTRLALRALSEIPATPDELDEMRQLVQRMARQKGVSDKGKRGKA